MALSLKKKTTPSELGRKGGIKTKEIYGKEHYSENGRKSGNALFEKGGSEYFKRIRQIGIEKQKKKREEEKSTLNRAARLILGE